MCAEYCQELDVLPDDRTRSALAAALATWLRFYGEQLEYQSPCACSYSLATDGDTGCDE
jgi:hypothetical protein